jgi:cell division protein FtsX
VTDKELIDRLDKIERLARDKGHTLMFIMLIAIMVAVKACG